MIPNTCPPTQTLTKMNHPLTFPSLIISSNNNDYDILATNETILWIWIVRNNEIFNVAFLQV